MTMLAKMRMPFLVSTMSNHQQEELSVVEGSVCNYSCFTWKPTSCAMVAKVFQIAL
jgi:hypothetical protein